MNTLTRSDRIANSQQLEQWAHLGKLYALVDPFFEVPNVTERVRLETRDTDPLFYELIAWDRVTYEPPYLLKLSSENLTWLMNGLSTERWGIFIASDSDLISVARHFQKFVIAQGPDQNPYFLRFHDASVLDVLMRTWTTKEQSIFFGPAMAFGLPDLDTFEIKLELNPFTSRPLDHLPRPEDCLLKLQDWQLAQCSEAIDRDLVKVIYWHLRNHHSKPVQFIDKRILERRIEVSIKKARGYGLGTISDLAGFTALMFELAPNFDDHPSFKRILADPSLPAEAKMRTLSQSISDQEWNEALKLYDRLFWQSAIVKRK